MGAKTHKTAVVVIPPEEVWAPIQRIRERLDRNYSRWMPHVTLIYPYRPAPEFDVLAPGLEAVLRQVAPFDVHLSRFDSFSHRRTSHTVWLDPQPAARLIDLQRTVQAVTPDCDDVQHFPDGFTPHLSVGQMGSEGHVNHTLIELRATWKPLQFQIRSAYLIFRDSSTNDVFQIGRTIPLGGGGSSRWRA